MCLLSLLIRQKRSGEGEGEKKKSRVCVSAAASGTRQFHARPPHRLLSFPLYANAATCAALAAFAVRKKCSCLLLRTYHLLYVVYPYVLSLKASHGHLSPLPLAVSGVDIAAVVARITPDAGEKRRQSKLVVYGWNTKHHYRLLIRSPAIPVGWKGQRACPPSRNTSYPWECYTSTIVLHQPVRPSCFHAA